MVVIASENSSKQPEAPKILWLMVASCVLPMVELREERRGWREYWRNT